MRGPVVRAFVLASLTLLCTSVGGPAGATQVGRALPSLAASQGCTITGTTGQNVANRIQGTISVIRFATRKVVATWHEGRSPDMEQVSPNSEQLWVSDRYDGSVSIINTNTGQVIHRVKVGPKPHGLAYFPQPGRYSVGHNGVYR